MPAEAGGTDVVGRLVLADRVVPGRVVVRDARIESVEVNSEGNGSSAGGPLIAPGFVDVHVHGWGGHDAMGSPEALDGMARALLRRGVTSFLPTGVTSPLPDLVDFAARVRTWIPSAPQDGAEPLGFNIEGPFIATARKGAHDQTWIRDPSSVAFGDLEPLVEGLRLMTVAPEIPGALELIAWLRDRGVATSMGHSNAGLEDIRAGYAAGARGTTHLFNAMSGMEHRAPGVAVAALTTDEAWVELIADGQHVHPALWPIVTRTKPSDRVVLVSDAISLAGTSVRRARIGSLEVEVVGERCTLAGTTTLAGSVIALDSAVRNMVAAGVPLPAAAAAGSANPLGLLGVTDRGRIAEGQRADLVELDDELRVRRVMRAGTWIDA